MVAQLQVDTIYFSMLVGTERAEDLLLRAGIATPGKPLPQTLDMVDFWRCCVQNIQHCNDESHGVADEPVPRGSLSVLFTAAKEADTLGEAMRRLSDAARLVRKDCTLAMSRGRDVQRLTVNAPAGALDRNALRAEIYAECFAIVTHCALRWMVGKRINPVRVRGAAALREMGGELLDSLGTVVFRRGSGVSIDYALADMDLPVVTQKYTAWGEAEFASFLAMLGQDRAEHEASDLSRTLAEFERGRFSQEEVAENLCMSPATLRRRLAMAGHSFRELSADYRTEKLKDLLSTDMPLSDIAEQLDLSDERSLRRYCAHHLGCSPARFRSVNKGDAGLQPDNQLELASDRRI